MVLRQAWKKGKIQFGNRPLFFDHDYAAEIVQKQREYNEIKKCLKQKGICFQPAYTSIRIHCVEVPAASDEEHPAVTRLGELLGWQCKDQSPWQVGATADDRAKETRGRVNRKVGFE